jgi:hypothetical protein|tara:strand:+ start:159 stop:323 length:165 start_codon:yes stop_codon:yes gene_type:complete
MKSFITNIKVLLTTGLIFGLIVAAPFMIVIAGIFFSLLAAWFVAKLLFMNDDSN